MGWRILIAGGGDAILQNQVKLVWLNILYVYKTRKLLDEIVAAHLLVYDPCKGGFQTT